MRWAGHVELMGRIQSCTKLQLKNLKGRIYSEDIDVNGRIMDLKNNLGGRGLKSCGSG
jgi:hypothetical protein